ncbi:MAG: hypothetical protein JWQ27_712 [Ferruginibacter sp.]|nr:hypothetical protein [Ferruginibacter sp.]
MLYSKLVLPFLLLMSYANPGAAQDTTFLKKSATQAVFIERNPASDFYKELTDFTLSSDEQLSYEDSSPTDKLPEFEFDQID